MPFLPSSLILRVMNMAEREGFEPPELSLNGFQDRRLRPLGHPSDYNCGPVRKKKTLVLRCPRPRARIRQSRFLA